MKRLNYDTQRHQKGLALQRQVISIFEKLVDEFLDIPLAKLPRHGIFHLRSAVTLEGLQGFVQAHQEEWGSIVEQINKHEGANREEVLQRMIEKLNVHAYQFDGQTLIQLDYSKVIGRWWNLLTENSRGILFSYPNLEVVSLPFQKFYNANERADTQIHALNHQQDSYVMEKLDGTMIHLFEVNGKLYSSTRGSAGEYYFNDKAMTFVNQAKYSEILHCVQSGYTPIFEILLKEGDEYGQTVSYPDDDLRLIAIRHRETGAYVHPKELASIAKSFGLTSAKFYNGKVLFHILAEQETIQNQEGWVVYYKNGMMVKVKGEEYLKLNRNENAEVRLTAHGYLIEQTIYQWMLEDVADDQLSAIKSDELRKELDMKHERIVQSLEAYITELHSLFKHFYSEDRKTFALALKGDKSIDKTTFGLLFEIYKGNTIGIQNITWDVIENKMKEDVFLPS